MLLIGGLISVAVSLSGACASFFLDSAPAPAIVLLLTPAAMAALSGAVAL